MAIGTRIGMSRTTAARVYFLTGTRGVARRGGWCALLTAFGLFPESGTAQAADRGVRARAVADSGLAALPETTPAAAIDAAEALLGSFGAGDVWGAAELMRVAIDRWPARASLWETYGRMLARRGDLQAALNAYHRALVLDSASVNGRVAIAMLLSYRGDGEEALHFTDSLVRAYEAAGAIEPLRDVLAARAAILVREARWEEAAAALQRRIGLDTARAANVTSILDHPYWDWHLLGNVLLASGDADSAEAVYRTALANAEAPGNGGGEADRVLRSIRGDFQFFETSLALHRGNPALALALANGYRASNRNAFGTQTALAHLARGEPRWAIDSLTTFSRDGYYRDYVLARAHLAAGDTAGARQLLRDVVTFHQLGNRFWLHEYAIIGHEAQGLFDAINGGTGPWRSQDTGGLLAAHPSWSPDGVWIAFDGRERRGEPTQIYVVRPDGTGLRRLTHGSTRKAGPAWSADSQTLYFISSADGTNWHVSRVGLGGGEETRDSIADGATPRWSPNGTSFLMSKPSAAGADLWLVEGNERTLLVSNGSYNGMSAWRADGAAFVYASDHGGALNLYRYDMRPGAPTRLTFGAGRDLPFGISPDGRTVLFHSDRHAHNTFQTFTLDTATGAETQLTFGPKFNGVPSWSPDAGTIVFESGTTLYLMDVDGARLRPLLSAAAPSPAPSAPLPGAGWETAAR